MSVVAIYWFIFKTNFFNLDWYSCFIMGEEIWLEGFFGVFKDLQEYLTQQNIRVMCIEKKSRLFCVHCISRAWMVHSHRCVYKYIYMCVCVHIFIRAYWRLLLSLSQVCLEKFLACQRCLENWQNSSSSGTLLLVSSAYPAS